MQIHDDTITLADGRTISIYSDEGFQIISALYVRSSWAVKYSYTFTWMGRPVIQLPDDMIRIQEVIFQVQPDVIIETGIAHGGSLIFYASLCKAMGKGRIIGVDIEIRPHNRQAIEAHFLFPYLTLIEGDSAAPEIIAQVQAHINPGDTTLILLDSNHSKAHVLAELNAYAPLVTPGSYIVATDGMMQDVVGAPRSQPDWSWNNPQQAALEFVAQHPDFVIEEPPLLFDEGDTNRRVTYWPQAYIKRLQRD